MRPPCSLYTGWCRWLGVFDRSRSRRSSQSPMSCKRPWAGSKRPCGRDPGCAQLANVGARGAPCQGGGRFGDAQEIAEPTAPLWSVLGQLRFFKASFAEAEPLMLQELTRSIDMFSFHNIANRTTRDFGRDLVWLLLIDLAAPI
jgi:hypothetical protein